MTWHSVGQKWYGSVKNCLKKTSNGWAVKETTTLFVNEADCIEATKALSARIAAEYEAHVTALAAADSLTKDLPRAPNVADAEVDKVYWHVSGQTGHKPYRVVRSGTGASKRGMRWVPACQDLGCAYQAVQTVKGTPREFCTTHGMLRPYCKTKRD